MDTPGMSPEEIRKLVYELQAHQIELELQNEELRRTQQELVESRDRYSDLYNFAPVGYVTVGHNSLIIEANLTLAEMLGVERRALISHSLSSFVFPDDQDIFYRHRREILESKQRGTCQIHMLRRDTEPLWAEMDSILIEADDESDVRFRMAISDITERKRAEEALRGKEEKYRRLFEGVEESIWEQDFSEVGQLLDRLRCDGIDDLRQHLTKNQAFAWKLADAVKVIDVNEATLRLFGASSKEEFVTSMDKVHAPSAIDIFIDQFCAIWDGNKTFRTETTQRTLDGRELSVILSLPIPTTKEGFASVPVSIIDITERKQAEEALSLQATHDALTGLINRVEFERRLGRVLNTARERHDEHALCYLDLDQFKVINDTCGHMAGDELLRQLGRLLPAIVRKRDTLARLGGDEFGVLMEQCTLAQARRVADNVRGAIAGFRFV